MAESGWDFSSRWLANTTDLKTTQINDMFPSDLNTLMGLTENYLATLSLKYGRTDLRKYFESLVTDRKSYFGEIFNGLNYPDYSRTR
jgi:alpha,alpha-trehalase